MDAMDLGLPPKKPSRDTLVATSGLLYHVTFKLGWRSVEIVQVDSFFIVGLGKKVGPDLVERYPFLIAIRSRWIDDSILTVWSFCHSKKIAKYEDPIMRLSSTYGRHRTIRALYILTISRPSTCTLADRSTTPRYVGRLTALLNREHVMMLE
jgi:hypothetical protein